MSLQAIEFAIKNARAWGHADPMPFLYKGYLFGSYKQKNERTGSPHPNIIAELLAHILRKKKMDEDKKAISQILGLLLIHCFTLQDIRDALPECIVRIIVRRDIPRTRPEAWCIQDNERAMRSYQQILPRIEFYMASQLLY